MSSLPHNLQLKIKVQRCVGLCCGLIFVSLKFFMISLIFLSLCLLVIQCHDLKQMFVWYMDTTNLNKQHSHNTVTTQKNYSQHVTVLSSKPWIDYSTYVWFMWHCLPQLIKVTHIIIYNFCLWHGIIKWCCRCLHLVWTVYLNCWKSVRIVMASVTSAKLSLQS